MTQENDGLNGLDNNEALGRKWLLSKMIEGGPEGEIAGDVLALLNRGLVKIVGMHDDDMGPMVEVTKFGEAVQKKEFVRHTMESIPDGI